MNPLFLGLLLWLWSKQSKAPASSASSPAAPAAPSIPLASEAELLQPPEEPSAADLLWARYASDPKRGGPRLRRDTAPTSRKLTAFEKWALKPYFPVAADLSITIHNGKNPRAAKPSEQPVLDKAIADTPGLWALTLLAPGKKAPEIYLPNKVRPLGERWWLGVLAHELAHVAQIRMGMTAAQTQDSIAKHGYQRSPIEVQARHFQAKAHRDLYERARQFYAPK